MNTFTIKDLENLSGIKAHTLRIWEQRYQFLKPSRSFTNIRYYSCDELKKVLNIALLNTHGYKISRISKMNETEINEKIIHLNQAEAIQEKLVHELIKDMVDLDMERFEKMLNRFIADRGIEKAITQLIFPFLEKIGILWLTNHINPAQEHLVSIMIRQKLIVGIESLQPILRSDTTILLFLPEGEYHELGLLFMYYIFKSRGIKVIYLGCSIPLKDIEYVVNLKKPDYLYCHLTTVGQKFNFDKFLLNVSKKFSTLPVIVSGQLTNTYQRKYTPRYISRGR